MVTIPVFCNEILVRFLNFPAIFGLRHYQLPFKTQFCSCYKISLKLSLKFHFFPHFPAPTGTLPGQPWLWTQSLELWVGRRGRISSCTFSSRSPSSLPFGVYLSGATFLYTISEEEKTAYEAVECQFWKVSLACCRSVWFFLITRGHG